MALFCALGPALFYLRIAIRRRSLPSFTAPSSGVESEEGEGGPFTFKPPAGKDHLGPDMVEFVDAQAFADDSTSISRVLIL